MVLDGEDGQFFMAETLLRRICSFIMLKTFEEIRTEVLELDSASQLRLRDDINRNLESEHAGYPEAKRRSEAVSRGEMKTVDGPDALARVKKLISR